MYDAAIPETQELNTEVRQLFATTRSNPRVIRLAIRMRDMIDEEPLLSAVDKTMHRHPYLRVRLERHNGHLVLARNRRPVRVFHSPEPHMLASDESHGHLLCFSWWDNWIWLDVFHGITDGTGAYALARTLLWYYCNERYGVHLESGNVRLLGDKIEPEEWQDPTFGIDLPAPPSPSKREPAFDLIRDASLGPTTPAKDYAIAIPEGEFMRFNIRNDGSPATMLSLLLCRAVERIAPNRTKPLRINLCVNQRPALGAPSARHNLVGMATLEYKDGMRDWPLERQCTIFRGQTMVQTVDERVLAGVTAQRTMAQRLLAMDSDTERAAYCASLEPAARSAATATVSYVGRANFSGSERYIRDMRLTTGQTMPVLVEVSAVNGIFKLDFMQTFASDALVRALCRELEDCGITYDLQDVRPVRLAAMDLPW